MPTTAEEKAEMKSVPYRQCVGALLYLAHCTRPDIAHAVGACARFGSNPGRVHWKALKRHFYVNAGAGLVTPGYRQVAYHPLSGGAR